MDWISLWIIWVFSSSLIFSIGFLLYSYEDIYTPVAPIIIFNCSQILFNLFSKSVHDLIVFLYFSFSCSFCSSFFIVSYIIWFLYSSFFCCFSFNLTFIVFYFSIDSIIFFALSSLINNDAKKVIGFSGLTQHNSTRPLFTTNKKIY